MPILRAVPPRREGRPYNSERILTKFKDFTTEYCRGEKESGIRSQEIEAMKFDPESYFLKLDSYFFCLRALRPLGEIMVFWFLHPR